MVVESECGKQLIFSSQTLLYLGQLEQEVRCHGQQTLQVQDGEGHQEFELLGILKCQFYNKCFFNIAKKNAPHCVFSTQRWARKAQKSQCLC